MQQMEERLCTKPKPMVLVLLMTGSGYEQTFSPSKSMSALPPRADIPRLTLDFRF